MTEQFEDGLTLQCQYIIKIFHLYYFKQSHFIPSLIGGVQQRLDLEYIGQKMLN
jgi:hypothetical protein